MRNEDRDASGMGAQCARNLQGRDGETPGRVQDHVNRLFRRRRADGVQHFFRIVHVDIARQWKPEEAHGFLAVDHRNHPRPPHFLNAGELGSARHPEPARRDQRLQRESKKDDPEQIGHIHQDRPVRK